MKISHALLLLVALCVLVVVIAGCATQYVPVSSPLDCPDPLVLEPASPEIKAQINDMKANNKPLYEFFYYRSKLQKDQRATLQAVCRSTHEEQA